MLYPIVRNLFLQIILRLILMLLFFGLDKDRISDFNMIEGDAKAGIVKIDLILLKSRPKTSLYYLLKHCLCPTSIPILLYNSHFNIYSFSNGLIRDTIGNIFLWWQFCNFRTNPICHVFI